MKQFFLLGIAMLFFFFPTNYIEAQDLSKESIKISMGILISNKIGGEEFHKLRNRTTEEFIPMVDFHTVPMANYRIGLTYQRNLVKALSLKVGAQLRLWNLAYAEVGDKIYRSLYIDLPLGLQYKFGKQKLQPFVELGTNFMFLIANGERGPLFQPSTFALAVESGVGFSYQISDHISYFAQIVGDIQLKSNPNISDIYPYELGLMTGLGIHF